MKNVWRIALILSLALCLLFALIACDSNDGQYVLVTDINGETMTDEEGNIVTALDADGDGQPDETSETTGSDSGSIENAGANNEEGYGPIIRPN